MNGIIHYHNINKKINIYVNRNIDIDNNMANAIQDLCVILDLHNLVELFEHT